MIDWLSTENILPEKNQRVLAWLVGFQLHSDMQWHREGYAFMVRHPDEKTSVHDGWARPFFERALEELGADSLTVTHWAHLNPPSFDAELNQGESS